MVGLPGEHYWLWAARHGDPQRTVGAAGQPGQYRLTVLFARPSYRNLPANQQSFLGALEGDSHLAISRPAMVPAQEGSVPKIFAGTPEGRLEFTAIANNQATALAKSDPVVLIRDDPRQEQDLEQARVAASSSHAAGVVARSSVRDQAE